LNLVGDGGVFFDQVNTIGNFAHDPSIIIEQIDRVLDRALAILSRESNATTLAGGMFVDSERQHRISNLGATTNTGDGMRISGNDNANYRGGPTPFAAGAPVALIPFDTRADPNAHKVSVENHSSLPHKAAGKLQAKHDKKNEGLYRTGMGSSWITNNPGYTTLGGVATFAVLVWGITKVITNKPKKSKRSKNYSLGFQNW
jgi:hypothetical protein